MESSFFALISRMRHIGRWGLMRNNETENVQEHSHMVAVLAHALAVIGREVYGKDLDPDRCAAAALYHDASEIITGDLPTPIKYHDEAIRKSYKDIEQKASERLLSLLAGGAGHAARDYIECIFKEFLAVWEKLQ